MTLPRVVEIRCSAGQPTVYVLARNSPDREYVNSFSLAIQKVLFAALASEAPVTLELFPKTDVVKRVEAIESRIHRFRSLGDWIVTRLATQQGSTGDDFLEVFLKRPEEAEKAYPVLDPRLQQILQGVFLVQESPGLESAVTVKISDGIVVEAWVRMS